MGMTDRPTARERIASLTDNFDEQDAALRTSDPLRFENYKTQLELARSETGLDEACVWGWADIDGINCALVVFDFSFLGGSMGMVVGEKVARAFDAARKAKTPVVTITASGGARMQEGMWSLVQMAKTVQARREHADAGGLHIAVLTSPTTGGVYASFASLADVIYAESGATVGFAGPRVVEQLTGAVPTRDVHLAESAFAHGLVDAIVEPTEIRDVVARTLKRMRGSAARDAHVETNIPLPDAPPSAWDRLQQVRDPAWPKGRRIGAALLRSTIELHGDRSGQPDDPNVAVLIGTLNGTDRNVMVIGQDASGSGRLRAEGFHKAIRALGLAGRIGLPVVTLIDTRGADPLPDSEGLGVASAIAHTFEAMLACPSPTLAVITGEGGSGGALSMAVADRVIALENAVFSVIAPEGAAAILYRDDARAPELADRLRITVDDLTALGLVDTAIGSSGDGVGAKAQVTLADVVDAVSRELSELVSAPQRRRLRARGRRWRRLAVPKVHRHGGG